MFSPPDVSAASASNNHNSHNAESAYAQLEARIKALETEIPFFSSKAAELMVQRTDDNTYKLETERRLEELAMLREQIKRLPGGPPPGSSAANSLRTTPQTPHAMLHPMPPPQQQPPPLQQQQPQQPPQQPQPLPLQQPVAIAASSVLMPVRPPPQPQPLPPLQQPQPAAYMPHPQQQPQQPQVSRSEAAILAAKKRASAFAAPIEAIFLCTHHLEYNDLLTLCCVSKTFKSRVKRSPGWRRVVIGLEATLRGHIGKITALTWFDTAIVTGGADGKIKFWDKNYNCFKTNNITPTPAHKFIHPKVKELQRASAASGGGGNGSSGHHNMNNNNSGGADDDYPEFPLAVTSLLTLDQKTILIGGEDGRLMVWITTEKRDFDHYVFQSALTCMTLNYEQIFLGSADGQVALVSRRINLSSAFSQLAHQHFHYGNKQHDSAVTALAFAGERLFSGSASGRIYVWKVGHAHGSGEPTLDFMGPLVHRTQRAGVDVEMEHADRITSLAGSSERLFSASWDCTIKQWNPLSLELLRDINVLPIGICWSLVIRRDQKPYSLVAGVRDNDLCVMDFETLEVLSSCNAYHWTTKLNQHGSWVKTLFAHPDGRIISGGSDDWTVKVWSAKGRCIQTPQPYIFFGLPKGPIVQDDLDILLSKSGSKYTPQHLQDSKLEFDRACYATDNLTAEQKTEYQYQAVRQQEAWEKYRSEKRKKDEQNAAAAAMAAAAAAAAEGANQPAADESAAAAAAAPAASQQGAAAADNNQEELTLDVDTESESARLVRQASILSQRPRSPQQQEAPTPGASAQGDEQQQQEGGGNSPQDDLLKSEEEDDNGNGNAGSDDQSAAEESGGGGGGPAAKRLRTDNDDNDDDDAAANALLNDDDDDDAGDV